MARFSLTNNRVVELSCVPAAREAVVGSGTKATVHERGLAMCQQAVHRSGARVGLGVVEQ